MSWLDRRSLIRHKVDDDLDRRAACARGNQTQMELAGEGNEVLIQLPCRNHSVIETNMTITGV